MKEEPFQQCHHHESWLCLSVWEKQYPWLVAGMSTRQGGQSTPPFHSMNVALHVEDRAAVVVQNRKRLMAELDFPFDAWTSANQIHSANLYYVSQEQRGKGRLAQHNAIQDTDGLYTDQPNIFLTSFYADCVPLFILEPKRRIIGIAHAGWKGTVSQIGPKMVQEWVHRFDIDPQDLHVAIGPSIEGCCYEVDDRVASQFQALDLERIDDVLVPTRQGRYMLDLKRVNVELLKKAGIQSSHIEVSKWCTGCNRDLFFSYRMENGRTGRMTAFLAMKEEATRA